MLGAFLNSLLDCCVHIGNYSSTATHTKKHSHPIPHYSLNVSLCCQIVIVSFMKRLTSVKPSLQFTPFSLVGQSSAHRLLRKALKDLVRLYPVKGRPLPLPSHPFLVVFPSLLLFYLPLLFILSAGVSLGYLFCAGITLFSLARKWFFSSLSTSDALIKRTISLACGIIKYYKLSSKNDLLTIRRGIFKKSQL